MAATPFCRVASGSSPQVSPTVPPAILSDGSARGSVHLATFDVLKFKVSARDGLENGDENAVLVEGFMKGL